MAKRMKEQDLWLLVKRGLFYRPNDCGYTGIRDHAGRYTNDEARARAGSEIKMVRLVDAPEFSEACFDDLARAHLTTQRDVALNEAKKLRECVRLAVDHLRKDGQIETARLLAEAATHTNGQQITDAERKE